MKYENLILKIFLLYFLFFTKNICMDNQENFKNQILINQFTPQNLREKFIPNEFNRYLTPLKNREQSFGNMDGKLSKSFLSMNNNNNDNLSTNFQFQSDINQYKEKQIISEKENDLSQITNNLQNIRNTNKELQKKYDEFEKKKQQYEKNLEIFCSKFCPSLETLIKKKLENCEIINIEKIDIMNIPGGIHYLERSPEKKRLKNFTNKIIEEYYLLQIKQEEEIKNKLNQKLKNEESLFQIQKQNDNQKITDIFNNSSNKI